MKRIYASSNIFNSGGATNTSNWIKLNAKTIFHSEEEIVVKLKLLKKRKLITLANFWPKFRSTLFLEKLKQSQQPLRDLPRNVIRRTSGGENSIEFGYFDNLSFKTCNNNNWQTIVTSKGGEVIENQP